MLEVIGWSVYGGGEKRFLKNKDVMHESNLLCSFVLSFNEEETFFLLGNNRLYTLFFYNYSKFFV